jgi:2-polyprenyl-3-methyl-5-hydroxy-6-metoxy-1,4-benzoquinol methylase
LKTEDFNSYKKSYRQAIQRVLEESELGRLDEAAFPAYTHKNPFINRLFWQRLRKVMEHISRPVPYESILDFGCGSGVMLPFLSQISKQVTAGDVDILPLERMRKYIPLQSNVKIFDLRKTKITDLPKNSFDIIIALDVLEHVKDLQSTVNELLSLLNANGQIVISGPTENILYKVGRKLAGPEYSGDYHERGIAEIKTHISQFAKIENIAMLYPMLPLFDIFSVTKN